MAKPQTEVQPILTASTGFHSGRRRARSGITRYVPFGNAKRHSHASPCVLCHKIANDTKGRFCAWAQNPRFRSTSFRRVPIDDSARRIRARLLMNLGAKILRSAIYWANEETKFVTAASYSAGNETPKLSFHVCGMTGFSFLTALHVIYQFVQTRKFLY
jgi:hypothetical protein